MVFCSTKRMVDEVVERLPGRGFAAEALHGDVSQTGRERVLRTFREGRIEVLVATDVAARGLDVPDVALVVNFDIPPDPEYYVHRIGRTGRSGQGGEAITFVNPREMRELQVIERVTGAHIRRGEMPTPAEAEERETQILEERVLGALESGAWRRFSHVAAGLGADRDPLEVAAAALALASERRTGHTRPGTAARLERAAQPAPEERRRTEAGPAPRHWEPRKRASNTHPKRQSGGAFPAARPGKKARARSRA